MIDEILHADRSVDRRPVWFAADAALAGVLVFLVHGQVGVEAYQDLYGPLTASDWALLLGPSLLLVLRRIAPVGVLFASVACIVVAAADFPDANSVLALPFAVYTVALTRTPRASAVLVALAAVPASSIVLYGPDPAPAYALAVFPLMFAAAWLVGVRLRQSRERAERLAAEAAAAIEAGERAAAEAVVRERAHIARELHDAVGHAVNVMVMQAGAARLSTTEPRAVAALRGIEEVGRTALTDLDRMLGLLNQEGGTGAPLEPSHGLSDVARLVEGVRAAGVEVRLDDRRDGGQGEPSDHLVGATVYRVVQEALTNVAKHAGPARVEVVLESAPGELVVSVTDDGRGAAAQPPTSGGRGLVGMRERVAVLGGAMSAGPLAGGGYQVKVRIPSRQVEAS